MLIHVGKHYRVREKLGAGSFGEIFRGENTITQEEIAIKVETQPNKISQLLNETKIYKLLSGGIGIPNIKYFGEENNCNVMVMDLLGKSIEELFSIRGKKFSLKTILMIADQILTRIEYQHKRGFIHRDIKPENFIIGIGKQSNQVFMIDMGLSKRYCDPITLEHIPFSDNKPLVGTARYTSLNTHSGIEQSRRDDLESVAYLLIFLIKGSLPWQSIRNSNRLEKHRSIFELKQKISIESLCNGIPNEFSKFLYLVRELEFDESPNYIEYKELFKNLFISEGYIYDYHFDWITPTQTEILPCASRLSSLPVRENVFTNNKISSKNIIIHKPTSHAGNRTRVKFSPLLSPKKNIKKEIKKNLI